MNFVTSGSIAARLAAGSVRPSAEDLAPLSPTERTAVRIAEFVHRNPLLGALSHAWLWHVNRRLVAWASRRVTHVRGAEALADLDPGRGVLICSNHRSFFDQFVIMTYYSEALGRLPPLYFPVRNDFFYESALGVVINAAAAAFHMYPPVFREASKRGFNLYTQARLVELLTRPGFAVGVHPEGKRGKGPDPYTLLPAQVGVGQLILEARPTVLPVFINGLSNDFFRQIAGNFTRRASPIVILFGAPIELRLDGLPNRVRTHKDLADRVMDAIRQLGRTEREIRAGLSNA